MSLADLAPTLQLAIGPVILISGVGLILLSMTNRFGRIIDRSRLLAREHRSASEAEGQGIVRQLGVLSTRANLVRSGIAFGVLSVLLAALLIISLFVGALLQLPIGPVIVGLFVFCLLALIACLLLFLYDINLSLRALWVELPSKGRPGA